MPVKKRCAVCRHWFEPTANRSEFCSPECRRQRQRQQQHQWRTGLSDKQREELRAHDNRRRLALTYTCPVCGKTFAPRKVTQKWCSRPCRDRRAKDQSRRPPERRPEYRDFLARDAVYKEAKADDLFERFVYRNRTLLSDGRFWKRVYRELFAE